MDLDSRKYKFIEKLLKVEEEATLYKLESILNQELSMPVYDVLSPELKLVLDISIGQSERGEVKTHEEVMAGIKKKYNIV
jgi:hypothetical protein